MKVPYNYLPYEFQNVDHIINDWKELIKTTDFTLGQFVEKFEQKFAEFLKVKFCISTNNGTDALILALKSLNIAEGDEVITVANTFYATVGAIVAVGATPVLVDCDERYQIDLNAIKNAVTHKTKAVLPVHWGGASPHMEEISSFCKENNILIVEDACMGIGAFLNEKPAGTFGKVNAFSMHPLKSLNVMGDGGMVVTNDEQIANWMYKYRNHGMVDRDHIEFWGVNMRLQPLQAIVAMHGLDKLKSSLEIRNRNASMLDDGLNDLTDFIIVPPRIKNYKETFALYMVLAKHRNELKSYLEENDIEVKIHYPIPLNKQKAANKDCIFNNKNLINVNSQADELLTIPVHQFVTETQINYTIDKIKKFYKGR